MLVVILSQMAFVPSPSNAHSNIFTQLCGHGTVSQVKDYLNANIVEYYKMFINLGMRQAYHNGNVDMIKYLISLGGDATYQNLRSIILPNVLINRENHIQLARFVIGREYEKSESTLYQLCLDGQSKSSIMIQLDFHFEELKRHNVFDLCLWYAFVGDHQETVFFVLDLIREHVALIKREVDGDYYDTLLIIERIYGQNKLFYFNIPSVYGHKMFFHWACEHGHLEAVQQCLTAFYINKTCLCTGTSLADGMYAACKNNHSQVLRLLLESRHGKHVPIKDIIHVACAKNHTDMITILLEYFHSANDYVKYFIGAIQGGHVDLIQRFIDLGVDHWHAGFVCACEHKQYHLIDFFLNRRDYNFDEIFQQLCANGQVELAKRFIDHPTVSLTNGLTFSISRGKENIVQMIIDHEIKHPTLSLDDWKTALNEAFLRRYYFTSSTIIRSISQHINDTFSNHQISMDTYSSYLSNYCVGYPWFWDSNTIDLVVHFLRKGVRHQFDEFALIPPLLNRGISLEIICNCFTKQQIISKRNHLLEQMITRNEYLDQIIDLRRKIQHHVSISLSFVVCRDLIHVVIFPFMEFGRI